MELNVAVSLQLKAKASFQSPETTCRFFRWRTLHPSPLGSAPSRLLLLSVSGGSGSGPHDPEQGVDVVALDGVPTGGDHLVLGLPH